jgi:hypothetical protein
MDSDDCVEDDIQIDARVIDHIFSVKINGGAKQYLDRLEKVARNEIDFGKGEFASLTAGFEGMRKHLNQNKNGHKEVKVADFHEFGISLNIILKLRQLVHQLDATSPRQSVMSSKRGSIMTMISKDDYEDDYYDDFEEDDQEDVGTFDIQVAGKDKDSRLKKVEEIIPIISDDDGKFTGNAIPFLAPPVVYNRPRIKPTTPNSGRTDNGMLPSPLVKAAIGMYALHMYIYVDIYKHIYLFMYLLIYTYIYIRLYTSTFSLSKL